MNTSANADDDYVEGTMRRAGDRIRVSAQLGGALGMTSRATGAVRGSGTTSLQAYDHFLKGGYFWSHRDREGFRRGIQYFEQAMLAPLRVGPRWGAAVARMAFPP